MSKQARLKQKSPPPIRHQPAHRSLQERLCSAQGRSWLVPSPVGEALHSPAFPLGLEARSFMEPRFGHDFSKVRIHTDENAAKSARDLQAQAYTVGRDIFFNSGRYSPGTSQGRQLLAHELAHVVQQEKGRVQKGTISSKGDIHEKEAHQASREVLTGSPALLQVSSGGVPEIQRTDLYFYDTSEPLAERTAGCENWGYLAGVCEEVTPGARRAGVSSFAEVLKYLDLFISIGQKFRTIYFYTHGAPGYAHLPKGGMDVSSIFRLRGKNQVLENNARVLFVGCNVGEGFVGETFLLSMAKIFIGNKGGVVAASTSVTALARVPFTSIPLTDIYTPMWGELRFAQVDNQGQATMVGGIRHDPGGEIARQKERQEKLQKRLWSLAPGMAGAYPPQSRLWRADRYLDWAKELLETPGVSRERVVKAIGYLDIAEEELEQESTAKTLERIYSHH